MKTVAIISQKGGAGKTTVAIHLAVAAEQRGLRTAVFDLDPQASATSWSDRRNNPRPAVVAAQPPRLANLLMDQCDEFRFVAHTAVGDEHDLPLAVYGVLPRFVQLLQSPAASDQRAARCSARYDPFRSDGFRYGSDEPIAAPGQRLDEEDRYKQYPFAGDRSSWTGNHGACTVPIRIEDGGTVGYGGWGIFGMYVHNLTDITKPKTYGHLSNDIEGMGGIPFHTCYPVVADASKPELQKLNRNSIYIFANGRLIRDRLIQHAITEAYRNILPNGVFPVVLLFLEMPAAEVDVNVHPSKTEVRFRQSVVVHDFVRDTVRAALMKNRPVPQFASEIAAHPTASPALTPGEQAWRGQYAPGEPSKNGPSALFLQAPAVPPGSARLNFEGGIAVDANAAVPVAQLQNNQVQNRQVQSRQVQHVPDNGCAPPIPEGIEDEPTLESLRTLRPLGQIRNSFILAVNEDGLWIVDQHVAHERVLFERILRQREVKKVESQRLLIPLIVDLTPAQQAVFAEIAEELNNNGFEAEAFGSRTLAIKIAPSGLEAAEVERMLHELFDQCTGEQALNMEVVRTRIAASIACHAAIKVNMALEQNKMEWLLGELAKTDFPFSCPHGRPVVLRYSMKDIQKAFKRI